MSRHVLHINGGVNMSTAAAKLEFNPILLCCMACGRTGNLTSLCTNSYEICFECICKHIVEQAKPFWNLRDSIIHESDSIVAYCDDKYYLLLSKLLCKPGEIRQIKDISNIDWHISGDANTIARYLTYCKYYIHDNEVNHSYNIYIGIGASDRYHNYNDSFDRIYSKKSRQYISTRRALVVHRRQISTMELRNAHKLYTLLNNMLTISVDDIYKKLFGEEPVSKPKLTIMNTSTTRFGGYYIGELSTNISSSYTSYFDTSYFNTPSTYDNNGENDDQDAEDAEDGENDDQDDDTDDIQNNMLTYTYPVVDITKKSNVQVDYTDRETKDEEDTDKDEWIYGNYEDNIDHPS